jgi:pimeloyl-[acyl-carrier protein] methyl ester esterase
MTLWHETTGEGENLVLLHGWGMNSAVWSTVIENLKDHYQVTLIDLPGHGFSSDSALVNASLDDWADAVEALLPENPVVLGWSLGGLVALALALKHPARIRSLIMLTATPSFMQRDNWSCAMGKDTLENFAANLKANLKTTLNRFLSLQIKGCDNARGLLKSLKNAFSSRPQAKIRALENGLSFLHDVDLRNCLTDLNVPSLWIYGEKDTLVPVCASDTIKLYLPEASVHIIKGSGHVPFLSHPDETLHAIVGWKAS